MINKIINFLEDLYPKAQCTLKYQKDYELLLAVMLSAQTTDQRVNKVSAVLFKEYPGIKELSEAKISDLEDIIREIGTFKKKSIYLHEITQKLIKDGYDYIPNNRQYLESLPGIGHKSANVFLANIYHEPAIAVDTHVSRVSKRLGLALKGDNVKQIEEKLMQQFPKDKWGKIHHQMVLFGRYHCKAIKPDCEHCGMKEICQYKK